MAKKAETRASASVSVAELSQLPNKKNQSDISKDGTEVKPKLSKLFPGRLFSATLFGSGSLTIQSRSFSLVSVLV